MPDNYYDEATGKWVTHGTRYNDLVRQPRYASLNDLIYNDPERAWPLLLELIAETPEDLLGFVGAGEVENFIWQNGTAFINDIEEETKKNSRFRRAAFEINLTRGRLPEGIETRIVAAIGHGFELQSPDDESMLDSDEEGGE